MMSGLHQITLTIPKLDGGDGNPLEWERLWCPYGAAISFDRSSLLAPDTSQRGFLAPRGAYANAHCRTMAELTSAKQPLILCGIPGSGKSAEVWRLAHSIAKSEPDSAILTLRADQIGGEMALNVQQHPVWKKAQKEKKNLALFVDGFDQIRLETGLPISVLAEALRNQELDRVRLIVTCRAADWNPSAGSELLNLWGRTSKECVFELCPLKRDDVEVAARSFGIADPRQFFDALWEREIEAHAHWPLTLGGLLNAFKTKGSLPTTAREIFEITIGAMLDRVRDRDRGRLSRTQQRRLVERIAGILVLGRFQGVTQTRISSCDLLSPEKIRGNDELCWESVSRPGCKFEVEESDVIDVLKTGLFTPIRPLEENAKDSAVFGFTHHSFAEYLTANYLSDLSLRQLQDIFIVDTNGEPSVPPELGEVAAWLAARREAWFEFLLRKCPGILLRTDATAMSNTQKEQLAASMLERTRQEDASGFSDVRRLTPSSAFPGLDSVIQGVLRDVSAHPLSLRLAIRIVEKCKLKSVADDLWALLKSTEDQTLRNWIAPALCDALEDEELSQEWIDRFVALANEQVGPDEDDELKGVALRMLVPRYRAPREVLGLMTPRKDPSLFGSYQMFLWRVHEHLSGDDLLPFLDVAKDAFWAAESPSNTNELLRRIVTMALARLDEPEIADALVGLIASFAERHASLPLEDESVPVAEGEGEWECLDLLRLSVNRGQWHPELFLGVLSTLKCERLPLGWLLNQLQDSPPERGPVWAKLIEYFGNAGERERHLENFLDCYERFSCLRDALPDLREGMDIHETLKEREAEFRRKAERWKQERESKIPEIPTRIELINDCFDHWRKGEVRAWLRMHHILLLDRYGQGGAIRKFSIPSSEGWKELSDAERGEIGAMARVFLIEFEDPKRADSVWSRTAWSTAGYLAIDLLYGSFESDDEMREAVSSKWVRSFLLEGWNVDDTKREQAAILYDLNPEAVLSAFSESLRLENEKNASCQAGDPFKDCWGREFTGALVAFLGSGDLRPQTCRTAFTLLVERDPDAALDLASWWIGQTPKRLGGKNCETHRAKLFCAGFLTKGRLWSRVASLLQPPELARKILLENAWCFDSAHFGFEEHESDSLRSVFVLMVNLFGDIAEKRQSGFGAWTASDSIHRFLRTLEFQVAKRLRPDELAILRNSLPEARRAGFAFTVADARSHVAKEYWSPWVPEQLLRMVQIRDARLLHSSDELMDFLTERLAEYPNDPLRIRRLWNEVESRDGSRRIFSYSALSEERISNELAVWLEQGAKELIVNRESQLIEIMPNRIDIRVEMVVDGERIEVIIEVKKAENRKVKQNLHDQLVDRYLIEGGRSHGIYLVTWFGDKGKRSALGGSTPKEDEKRLALLKRELKKTPNLRVETLVMDCQLTGGSSERGMRSIGGETQSG